MNIVEILEKTAEEMVTASSGKAKLQENIKAKAELMKARGESWLEDNCQYLHLSELNFTDSAKKLFPISDNAMIIFAKWQMALLDK